MNIEAVVEKGVFNKGQLLQRYGVINEVISFSGFPGNSINYYGYFEKALTGGGIANDGSSSVAEFQFETQTGSSIRKMAVLERTKPSHCLNADVIFLCQIPYGGLLLFVGDGLQPGAEPHPGLNPLLQKYHCTTRPDALPAQLLKDPEMVKNVLSFGRLKKTSPITAPEFFLLSLQVQLHHVYSQYIGDDLLKTLPKSQLPSIVGVACILRGPNIKIASIGDPEVWKVSPGGSIESCILHQNYDIDALTRETINAIIRKNPHVETVDQARKTQKFKDWVQDTYDAKINVPGGVSVINGAPERLEISTYSIPMSWVKFLSLSTDGLTLGCHGDSNLIKMRINDLVHCQNLETLHSFSSTLPSRQQAGYYQHDCVQEKPHDDSAAVVLELAPSGKFEQSLLAQFFKDSP